MARTNYYQLLSVPRDASDGAIRDAYVRRLKDVHPDLRGPTWRPVATVDDIRRAYRCLSDPIARRAHDLSIDEENRAHVARIHRVERRLAHRARAANARGSGRGTRAPRRVSVRWALILAAALLMLARMTGSLALP